MSDEETIAAMREALEDEYKARATYRKVIERFGPVRPFVNIAQAEDRHVEALLTLFARLGVEPPADSWPARVSAPATLRAACEAGVRAEIENEAMYERLFSLIHEDGVRAVMRRLQWASQTRHLPAFQRCVARERRD
jgi:rubrerythrin